MRHFLRLLKSALCIGSVLVGTQAHSYDVLDISAEPLGTGTGLSVKPNLWFILDDSGSMNSTFTPDYVSSSICSTNMSAPGSTYDCGIGDAPYMAAGFNKSYYNPAITYTPPVDSSGTSLGNATPTAAKGNAFQYPGASSPVTTSCYSTAYSNIGSHGNKVCDLTTKFPHRYYCKSGVAVSTANCVEPQTGTPYAYPNGTYLYRVAGTVSVSRKSNEATIETAAPHYLSVGQVVSIDDVSVGPGVSTEGEGTGNSFNGRFVITAVPTATTFTYLNAGPYTEKTPDTDGSVYWTPDGAPYYYVMSGSPIWCSDKGLTNCPGTKWSSTNKYPRFGWGGAVEGVASAVTVTVTKAGGSGCDLDRWWLPCRVTTIMVDSRGANELLLYEPTSDRSQRVSVGTTDNNATRQHLADEIMWAINLSGRFEATPTVSCSGRGTNCQPKFIVTAPPGATAAQTATTGNDTFNNKTLTITDNSANITTTVSNNGRFSGGKNYQASSAGVTFTRYDIVPGNTFPKAATRTDCAGATCNHTEELQNFANWFSYYRGRLLMTKSAIARAFKDVNDASPGIGFRVGFSVISVGTSNPQGSFAELGIADFNASQRSSFYSKLFAITPNSGTPLRTALSRAGQMYAGNLGTDPMQYSCQQNYTFLATDGYWNNDIELNTNFNMTREGPVGNADPSASTNAPYKDKRDQSDTLADIARYYYKNDLKTSVMDDVPKASGDETTDAKMWQHMKTFTMGLGVDGNLTFCSSYAAGCSADYNTILADGAKDWGNPITNPKSDRIDDLWHAAVNGHGQYFSAADPNDVADGIAKALAATEQQTGSAAAAATSNLEPVAGDNYAYVASYTTNVWDGNLEAKNINLSTGELSSSSVWSARDQLDTLAQGTGRIIYTYGDDPLTTPAVEKKKLMTWSRLTTAEQVYFNPAQMTACNPVANCPGATSEVLFDFITGKLDATTNSTFRVREHVLGDIVSSQPVYVKTPGFNYADSGYASYKTTTRQGMVYVGANDGFLHAFNADTGSEVWAYAPSAVMPNLWRLADPAYSHRFYVDGTLTAADVKDSGWKTILVGGMNDGGKHYYAWDVTLPASPELLWEFTDTDMGFTYGNPVVTKLADGSWVVLLTSGYNNASGKGCLYVLDAITGAEKMSKICVSGGSSTSQIGLAKIANWVDDLMVNNTTKYVYGGDLNGDMWRFDLDAGTVTLLASVGEPITTRPELAEVKDKRVVLFGTGLFLQGADRTDADDRAIYAIKDDGTTYYSSVKGNRQFVEQTYTATGSTRTLSSYPVDWDSRGGWYIPLPDSGERVNVDPKIQLGTMVIASNVPTTVGANTCTVGGYAWINYIDFATGSDVKNINGETIYPSLKIEGALAVGVNIVRLPDGKVVAIITTADNRHPVTEVPVGVGSSKARRISWREIINN